jgi:hypothetical protein
MFAVVPNDKIHRLVAKIADAVEQDDRAHIMILSHMIRHSDIDAPQLRALIESGKISLGGNSVLMIFGRLDCTSGKRMNKETRVFFADEAEPRAAGYRPCRNCMRREYLEWKKRTA